MKVSDNVLCAAGEQECCGLRQRSYVTANAKHPALPGKACAAHRGGHELDKCHACGPPELLHNVDAAQAHTEGQLISFKLTAD